jgi:phosphopantetheine--protein transferase-like protein
MESPDADFRILSEQLLPHGQLAAVRLPVTRSDEELRATLARSEPQLLPGEQELAGLLAVPRRVSFVGGRLALRSALTVIAPDARTTPVLKTTRGAPQLPPGVLGSVSHKRTLAVGMATLHRALVNTIGIDVEEIPDERDLVRPDLAPKILTAAERHALAPLAARDALAYREAVRLRFALKEAVYKTIDPHVQRYVRFQEVEVIPESDGQTEVRLALPEFEGRRIVVRAWWTRLHGHLIATAEASPLE